MVPPSFARVRLFRYGALSPDTPAGSRRPSGEPYSANSLLGRSLGAMFTAVLPPASTRSGSLSGPGSSYSRSVNACATDFTHVCRLLSTFKQSHASITMESRMLQSSQGKTSNESRKELTTSYARLLSIARASPSGTWRKEA